MSSNISNDAMSPPASSSLPWDEVGEWWRQTYGNGGPYLILVTVVIGSAFVWRVFQSVVQTLLRRWPPAHINRLQMSLEKRWRLSNELTSLIHAAVSGGWALMSCLLLPNLITDMVYYRHSAPVYLLMMTTGYLLHDMLDMVINECSFRTAELMFHHVVAMVGMGIALFGHRYLGLVVFGLLIEVNSVTLHLRSLLNHLKVDRTSDMYQFVSRLNLMTMAVFRLGPTVYLALWLMMNILGMQWHFAVLTTFVVLSLVAVNTILAYRLLLSDGYLPSHGCFRQQRRLSSNNDDAVIGAGDEGKQLQLDDRQAIILA